jgi:hypothetical protein
MFTIPFTKSYSSIPEIEDTETFLSGSGKTATYTNSPRTLSLYIFALSLLLSSVSLSILGFYVGQRFPHDLDATCTRHTSKYGEL